MTFDPSSAAQPKTQKWASSPIVHSPYKPQPSVIDVLVIDDDPLILQSLQRLLQKRGYRVATAIDAPAGLQTAIRLAPSVIICDWLLPGDTSGLDICYCIKQDPQLSTTAFLMMTSHTDIANRVEALEAGADDLLLKPVDTAELIARVKAGLRLHQLTQDLREQTRRLEAELAEAAAYVASLLPNDTPKDTSPDTSESGRDRVSISSSFISSQALGGDCFDHYWLDPDYLVMYLLDVSGHGLGAALLSTSVLNVLRSQSLPRANFYRPETVLKGLNEAFQMDNQNDKYFTIWYGVYSRANRQLSYASAGHPPAILVTPATATAKATVERLRTPGMPIGMMPDTAYQWKRCEITSNARLYIFSDGIYEITKPLERAPERSPERAPERVPEKSQPASAQLATEPPVSSETPILGLDGFVNLLTQLEAQQQLSLDNLIYQVSAFSGNRFEDDLSLLEIDFQS
jgi:sigma-B regulation protein RsbU (phosphoserine phosphatase)